jgi:hypothetical protein
MSESQTINIDGKDYEYEDLSDVAKDAVQQLASLQQKQNQLQADYNQLEMARKGYLAALNTEISEEA